MLNNLKKLDKILIVGLIIIAGILVTGCVEEQEEIAIGHMHQTSGGGFRDAQYAFVRAAPRFAEGALYSTGSGDLREYLRLAIAEGKIGRGVVISYNHREVTQLLEQARPLIAEFPGRYQLRTELATFADPAGEIHTVWTDAYVIIYNSNLIAREDVPTTLEALANFDQPIGMPTTGCQGSWGTVAFYHHLGENTFRTLIENAEITGSQGDVTTAVKEGRVAVGISSLLDTRVRDGEIGVIWPEEGAIAKPGIFVIPNNPTDVQLEFADFLMSPEFATKVATTFNMASALPGGPVPQIVADNNFDFTFIPWADMADTAVAERVDAIVG